MKLLDKNKFKIGAFFKKNYFLDYENPFMAKICFDEKKLEQFIMNIDIGVNFVEFQGPKAMLIDELMIFEVCHSDAAEPDIQILIQLYNDQENYFLKITR